jgi:triacylglycerol lipase
MIGSRSAICLSLLCALLFCAFAAAGASANGTTAFTCSSGAGVKDFTDAHCDTGTTEGAFGHIEIEAGQETEVETTNAKTKSETKESTPAILKGTIAGVATEISCTTVSGSAKDTNKEISSVMQNEGTGVAIKVSGCTVVKPTKGCKVKEPIELTGTSITVENLGGKGEMGIEFKPKEGKKLSEVTFEGAECVVKGQVVALEGTMVATGGRGSSEAVTSTGATLLFTAAMTKETLKFAGNAAELSSTITVSMKEAEGKPITFTTVGAAEEAAECGEAAWSEENCAFWESTESEAELEKEFKSEEEWGGKEGEEAAVNPILFVHGYRGNLSTFKTMKAKFEAAGWPKKWLLNWDYEWWKSNATIAKKIETKVNELFAKTGAKKVDIISHSMGALSSRYYIKELKGWEKVDDWVSLAGPNHGTTLANKCVYTSCVEMRPGSAFLKNLNTVETPAGPNYGTWRAGSKNGKSCDWVIKPPRSVEMGGKAVNTVTKCLSHGELHEDKTVFEEVRKFVE